MHSQYIIKSIQSMNSSEIVFSKYVISISLRQNKAPYGPWNHYSHVFAIDLTTLVRSDRSHALIFRLFFYSQEQIFDFYETLRTGSNDSVDQFQAILEVFVADILKYRKEIKRLEDSYKRYKDKICFFVFRKLSIEF